MHFQKISTRLLCWWFGCREDDQDYASPEHVLCVRCQHPVSYGDMVGDTRHRAVADFFRYWFFRKWVPEKCTDCGKRFGKHEKCLPF